MLEMHLIAHLVPLQRRLRQYHGYADPVALPRHQLDRDPHRSRWPSAWRHYQ